MHYLTTFLGAIHVMCIIFIGYAFYNIANLNHYIVLIKSISSYNSYISCNYLLSLEIAITHDSFGSGGAKNMTAIDQNKLTSSRQTVMKNITVR